MTEEKYQELVGLFLARNYDCQMPINEPSIIDWNGEKWISATNAHSVLLLPDGTVGGISEVDKYPKVANVLPAIPETREFQRIAADALLEVLKGFNKERTYSQKPCEECDGDGDFFHGSHTYDCKECDGRGKVNDRYLWSEYSTYEQVRIGTSYFSARETGRLESVVKVLGDAELVANSFVGDDGKTRGSLFRVGVGYVLMMPCTPSTVQEQPIVRLI